MKTLRWLGVALGIGLLSLVAVPVGIGVVARFSDGPIGPFPGGTLRTGTLVSDPDVEWAFGEWAFAEGVGLVELALVEPPGSRIVGAVVHEGRLFVGCDLGFIGRRAPGMFGRILPMHRLKRWQEHALRDGRVVLRIAGKRYERQAVRETDPERLATLRSIWEEMASRFFSSPLLDVPTDPKEIWFFRMDPRPQT